ncbi:hypothetical protein SAMN05216439_0339 [Methanobrevibacter gottschalkii]|uniref:Uncharacterized protein n=2 Tax=Methanobrevibacter gottschalkii TaxID=190974 RepID=A0A3N5B3E0_9EURY|nr:MULTISPECIES: hypothetical protein [Methanobrevibacter]MCQ2970283.1 hypothetical protein [archaeon]OEC95726.1 hypothetical protein A9505_07210 [Methanobrevibacter sp. A27]RPF51904.1 hypothetical protein EDC42_1246 [Methanobrevibacter gottschalkii DSM 11977]SEL31338.1 hypothetical protein SAMN05216439_0339 [Methanobrevibacter gottschalkii]
MKIKLAIIFGVLIWILTFVLSATFNPIFTTNVRNVNIVVPIITIIVTGFFGILYIRAIDTNEIVEGFLVGIIFVIIDIILDYIFIISLQKNLYIIGNYTLHVFSMITITLLITTFLGYLAQMTIDLK